MPLILDDEQTRLLKDALHVIKDCPRCKSCAGNADNILWWLGKIEESPATSQDNKPLDTTGKNTLP